MARITHSFIRYQRARKGDLDALDKLLRLDKKLIFDNKIRDLYNQSENSSNRVVFRTINDALSKNFKPKITLRKVKGKIAGLISYYAGLSGYKLTAPEIQKLFDAVAHDFDKSKLIDSDLPELPESYSKTIQREKKTIKSSLPTGQ